MSSESFERQSEPHSFPEAAALKEHVNRKGEENLEWFSNFMIDGIEVCDTLRETMISPRLKEIRSSLSARTLLQQSEYFHVIAGSGLNPAMMVAELTADEKTIVRNIDAALARYIQSSLSI